ncbi:MAG: Uncharacterized protein G01um101425_183 [Candidatus Peregrinibacteria bacterium Gr01-1014_25]|nr:MAG: Uncharacterized protein G01um101425_183 [Candidatus Peregrinibacteria bacterium Gr01-1014_25]
MRTLLLIAGRSRRFWPLSEKSLFPICGKTVLEHQVQRLRDGGCTDIMLVVGAHNAADAARVCPDVPSIEQRELDLGMRGALLDALPRMGESPVLIVSGNDVIPPSSYAKLLAALNDSAVDGALLASRVSRYFPGGYLTLDGERVTGILEKPGAGNEPSNLVNIVAHVHRSPKALLAALQNAETERDDGYEAALGLLFAKYRYTAVPIDGPWLPIKYPWHLLPLLGQLLSDIHTPCIDASARIHPSAVIEGPVIIGSDARVFPHATIVGPCVIDAHAVVGNGCLVRQSSIGVHSVIGFQSEVKSSVLGEHVWTHSTYIGDSVIGRNVSFGAGSVTGNLRLDEGEIYSHVADERLATGLQKFGTVIGENCRIGIHAGISPGVKIGAGSFIGSSVFVSHDAPERSFVSMKNGEMYCRPNTASAPSPGDRGSFKSQL